MDPLLISASYGSVLILGKTGSGKSTLIHQALKINIAKRKMTFFYNAPYDRDFIANSKRVSAVSEFSHLLNVPDESIVVIEDIIALERKNEPILRELINRRCHHKSLLLYAVAHHIYKTGVHSILPNFDYIIFTNHKANLQILFKVLNVFKHSQQELTAVRAFTENKPSQFDQYYIYWTRSNGLYFAASTKELLSCSQLQSVFSETVDASMEQRPQTNLSIKTKLQLQFNQMMQGSSFYAEASNVFSIVVNSIPLEFVRDYDLSFCFKYRNEQEGRVSIIDYVHCLLNPSIIPTNEIQFFHCYLKTIVVFPVFLLKIAI